MIGSQEAVRVPCPTCGSWGQLRLFRRPNAPDEIISFSCPGQTDNAHVTPTTKQLEQLMQTVH